MFKIQIDQRRRNVLLLGISFAILFSAYNCFMNLQKTLMNSIHQENPDYNADGYVISGILYIVFACSLWFSSTFVVYFGPKCSMLIAMVTYGFYILSFLIEEELWTYIATILSGIGASLLWTGQATYLVQNSKPNRIYNEIGIFWIMYQSSFIFGNLLVYFQWNHTMGAKIDRPMRIHVELFLSIFNVVAMFVMIFFMPSKPPAENAATDTMAIQKKQLKENPLRELQESYQTAKSKDICLLMFTMIYCGLHMTFLHVLSASMGFARYLSANSKELVPLAGTFHGFGSVTGGFISYIFGGTRIFSFKTTITVGTLCNLVSYVICLLALPNDAAVTYTDHSAILPAQWSLVLLIAACSLTGLGDACLHTQLYDTIGAIFEERQKRSSHAESPAAAFAIFKFVRSVATAAGFFYGNYISLYMQLTMLSVLAILSFISFHCLLFTKKTLTVETTKI